MSSGRRKQSSPSRADLEGWTFPRATARYRWFIMKNSYIKIHWQHKHNLCYLQCTSKIIYNGLNYTSRLSSPNMTPSKDLAHKSSKFVKCVPFHSRQPPYWTRYRYVNNRRKCRERSVAKLIFIFQHRK